MSALDQAIIKAYAKDRPVTAPVAAASAPALSRPSPVRRSSGPAIEQLYHDGSLYRVETPAAALPSKATRFANSVPPPHLPVLPPTSPRRNVRRSMLRLLAANHATAISEPSTEPPLRVARKVIFRHISHSAAPAPLGLLRPNGALLHPHESDPSIASGMDRAELAPETVHDEPAPAPLSAPVTVPAAPLAPQTAPLNIALDAHPQIEVHGQWQPDQALPAMVFVADATDLHADACMALVMVEIDALSAAENVAENSHLLENARAGFSAKTLDDHDEPRAQFRVDGPHASGRHRPHAKFRAEETTESPAEAATPRVEPAPSIEPEEPIAEQHEVAKSPTSKELGFAELPSTDLDLVDDGDQPAIAIDHGQAAGPAATKPAMPLWEIDQFQWPRTCQKLMADERGYLSRAGGKLLAAVQDGLRVLAITGSRRGEGRTTMALCLARAAAQAGVQVALMDADFARPQLASKVGLEIAFGWQDAALGNIPLSEAAVKSLADNITVLPLESSAAARALSLADPRVTATIRAAAATFELLILDLGPLAAGDDVAFPPGEACPLDAAIVVRDLRFATAAESEAIGHNLEDAGVEAVGIAENFVIDEEIPATSV